MESKTKNKKPQTHRYRKQTWWLPEAGDRDWVKWEKATTQLCKQVLGCNAMR